MPPGEGGAPGAVEEVMRGAPSESREIEATEAPADPFGLVGTRLDGKYDITAVVAEGGFGVVYRGEHRTLRKPIAVKVLKVPADLAGATRKQFLQKFELEAQTIARLDHPGIVRVLDFGASPMPEGEAAPWMVLEWIDGVTLETHLASHATERDRTPAACLELLRPVIEALAYAHDEGIAHRDLKPANLMLTTGRRGARVLRVLDFGIAKVMGPEESGGTGATATQTKLQAFSVHYAAPEQISGTRTGPWTDVHALGLMLTELLTGASPYPDAEVGEVYAAILAPQRPTPAKVGLDVGAWEPVLARALAFRPADRFQDAAALLHALEAEIPSAVGGAHAAEPTKHEDDYVTTVPRTTVRRTARSSAPSARRWMAFAVAAVLSIVVVGAWRAHEVVTAGASHAAATHLTPSMPSVTAHAASVTAQSASAVPVEPPAVVGASADAGVEARRIPASSRVGSASQGTVTAPVRTANARSPVGPTASQPRRAIAPPTTPAVPPAAHESATSNAIPAE